MSFDQNNAIEMLMPGCYADVKVELDDYAIIAPGMSFSMDEGNNQIVARGQIICVI